MNGIAICWPASSGRIRTIARTRRIPLHCHPRQATIPGSSVALIAPTGEIQLLCTIERVEGPRGVRLAAGVFRPAGYELIARRGTVRTIEHEALGRVPFRWRFIGQLRYFDQRTFHPITITDARRTGPFLLETLSESREKRLKFRPFGGVIAGIDRDHPEARLVRQYVSWIDSEEHFHQTQNLADGCWTDLFNTTRWTLFEAKVRSDDRTVRGAFGQLYDYRRSFARSPRLAVLLGGRPRRRMLDFLKHFGVAAVWQRANGTFGDSVDGQLTSGLRARYHARAR